MFSNLSEEKRKYSLRLRGSTLLVSNGLRGYSTFLACCMHSFSRDTSP